MNRVVSFKRIVIGMVVLLLPMFLSHICFATHNRAGEITYRQVSAYQFEVTIITYTYTKSAANHYRDSLLIQWGDSTSAYIHRIKTPELLPDDYQKNTYRRLHNFPGPGVYKMVMEDPNRNDGVRNIPNSVEVPFTITTTLRIENSGKGNNTPLLLNPPIDKAAKGQRFVHNPAAYDTDGDSLSYKLTVCAGQNGDPISGYKFPAASKRLYVDSITGDLVWDAPTEVGIFNVAMIIEEWRDEVKIGKIVRDMQIEVKDSKNSPPQLQVASPYCVRCGDTLRFTVSATDPDGDFISLQASGGPLMLSSSAVAQFPGREGNGTVSGTFVWIPSCDLVRQQPYIVVFKARDNNPETALADEKQVKILVIGHPPMPKTITPALSSVALEWETARSAPAQSYDLYRSTESANYVPDSCDRGMPSTLNYQLIAKLPASQTTYIDSDSSRNLPEGYTFCYRLVSRFADGAESYVSTPLCTTLKGMLPVLLNNSVRTTSSPNGSIVVRWQAPYLLDSTQFPHPWNYVVYRQLGNGGSFSVVAQRSEKESLEIVDSMLNTSSAQYAYKVELKTAQTANQLQTLGQTPAAQNVFISAKTADRKVLLSFAARTPWTNSRYTVYRRSASTEKFDSIGFATSGTFTDTTVQNRQSYQYRVASLGAYSDSRITHPLINWSQEISVIPLDTVAPRPLSFVSIEHRCDSQQTILRWNNINRLLPEARVMRYKIYYSPCQSQPFKQVYQSGSSTDTVFVHTFSDTSRSMSGCYYATAVDASGNESVRANDTCVYACPSYELPNIFTPNGDGQNELFIPIKNRFVDSVSLSMYDRWGGLVFRTSDKQINWDGTNSFTHKTLTDGVFYYVCDVYERWLDCQSHPRGIVGFVHKFSDGKQSTSNTK